MSEIPSQTASILSKSAIQSCCVSTPEVFLVICSERGYENLFDGSTPPCAIIAYMPNNPDGKWGAITFPKNSMVWPAIEPISERSAIIVSGNQAVYYLGGGGESHQRGYEEDLDFIIHSSLNRLKNIHGTIYLVGNRRGVYRRDGVDQWTNISGEMEEEAMERGRIARKKGGSYDTGFECIDGFKADDELYAAGENSDVWRFDKAADRWLPVDIGVLDFHVSAVCCADDGHVYLTGQGGRLLKGRNDQWQEIKIDPPLKAQTYDLAWYKDKLYIATQYQLYEYDGKSVKPVTYNTEDGMMPRDAGSLSANAGWLMSTGENSIAIYDGEQWKVLYGK